MHHPGFSRFHRRTWHAALTVGLAVSLPVFAQDQDDSSANTSRWGVGIGAVMLERPYKDYDNEVKPVPVLYFENRWLSVNSGRVDFKVNASDALSFRIRARYALDGYDPDDSSYLQGMEERDDSAWVGGAIVWNNSLAEVSAEYLTDAMNNSGGSRGRVQVERRFGKRFGVTPHVAAELVDQKFVSYYYGVRPEEATLDRPAYEGDATVNVEGGLRFDYNPSRRHTLFLDVSAVRFGSEIADSPLVERSSQGRLSAGYMFHF